jgi:large subunit ribosomal protein L13
MKTMNATHIVKQSEIERKWYLVDAEGLVLGRLASEVASILRGKNKPTFSTNQDCGDYVVIINAEKVVLTGDKLNQKIYRHHSGYIGGMKEVSAKDMMENKPEKAMMLAVKGMLPHTKLGAAQLKKLRVYAGSEHENAAQKPEAWNF